MAQKRVKKEEIVKAIPQQEEEEEFDEELFDGLDAVRE